MKRLIIKKLSKAELTEGLTLDLVNSINMQKSCSPVQMKKGDKPVKLLVASNGYMILYDANNILKDDKGKAMLFGERECQIARARYLMNYGKREKDRKVKELVESWKKEIRAKLDKVKATVDSIEDILSCEVKERLGLTVEGPSLNHILTKAMAGDTWPQFRKQYQDELAEIKPSYEQAEQMWADGKYVELLSVLEIKCFDNPMLTARLDNPQDMKVVINTFGAKAIDEWDGDMLTKYAQIEIEKQYPI